VDLSFANDILEALARIGDEVEQRVLSVLSQKIENFEQNPMKWMEPLMVILAGLLQMDAAIPMILGKLHEDDSLLAGYCIEALSRIGTDVVVAAIGEDFADADRHFRIYAANVLENIHSDLAVEKAANLLATEKDQQVQRDLAHAALSHFAQEAVEPVRQLIRSQRLDGDLRHLRDYLVETCTIMEQRFPEYDEWQAAGKQEREEHRKQLEAVKDDPTATLAWALGKAKDDVLPDEPEEQRTIPSPPNLPSFDEPLPGGRSDAVSKRAGRNDPCPCGSGFKYKRRHGNWPATKSEIWMFPGLPDMRERAGAALADCSLDEWFPYSVSSGPGTVPSSDRRLVCRGRRGAERVGTLPPGLVASWPLCPDRGSHAACRW